VITLSGIILTSGLSGSTISTQASVKQQVFNSINSKSNVEIARAKMNRINLVSTGNDLTKEAEDQTKNQETIALSEQPKTSDDLKKADGKVPEKKTVAATKPKVSQQVSRGSSEVDKLISRARSLQGVPYLWGGTTRDGFDCSGFVQYLFKASGVSLPRTSFEQYKVGTPVSRDQLKPGDLVFFTTYKPGASDVRIYIGGGRTIGSASEGVGIHGLSDNYWSKRYIGARRVL